MEKAVIILTCYNRREKTSACIKSIIEGNSDTEFEFVVVDDNSTDGTREEVAGIVSDVHIIEGTGSLFWNGGMNKGMEYAGRNIKDADYYVMINDDVRFFPGTFDKMIKYIKRYEDDTVLVGATCAEDGSLSYGGILYKGRKSLKLKMVGPGEENVCCDTFNANCVIIPKRIFMEAGATDPHYSHSMGDFDYGFTIRRLGYKINVFNEFAGSCNDNPTDGTWQDKSLPVLRRLKLKEGPKGLPFKDWFRYLKKNFGLDVAIVRSITPYVKILLRK